MSWLSNFFTKTSSSTLKVKFSKEANSWVVLSGYSIVFVGNNAQCLNYVKNLQHT